MNRREMLSAFALPAVAFALAGRSRAQPAAGGAAAPPSPVSLPEYEALARTRMAHAAWEYVSSGCADETTVRWNHEALARLRVLPRNLVDVTPVDTRVTLFGEQLPHPILLAPTAFHRLAHPEGEIATVRGAGAAKAVMVASSSSTVSIGEITAAASSPVWFQLYVQPDRGRTKALIERAEAAGCRALCITVDQSVGYARDRVTRLGKAYERMPTPNLDGLPPAVKRDPAAGRGRKFTWQDLEWVQGFARTPILLKGILHPDDADRAARAGVAGIVVSNHGGRALDSVPATIDALPRVTDRVAGRVPVLVDGGIRRGTDVVKCLALGAAAVLIGRPQIYGLAVGGADGVRQVVEILRAEFEAALALMGRRTPAELDRSAIWQD